MTKHPKKKRLALKKGHNFAKKYKVSVWASQRPYGEIPDDYFEERFRKNNTRACNTWSDNFNLQYFMPENMETNGAHEGTLNIKQAAGQCSFSRSYIDVLTGKAKKKKLEEISWIILLFEYEYSVKISGVDKDNYTTFLGAFDYDDGADCVHKPDES